MKASECKCVNCGKQAVVFWPVIDPDIPSLPYCRECVNKEKLKAMIAQFGDEDGRKLFDEWNKKNHIPNK